MTKPTAQYVPLKILTIQLFYTTKVHGALYQIHCGGDSVPTSM